MGWIVFVCSTYMLENQGNPNYTDPKFWKLIEYWIARDT